MNKRKKKNIFKSIILSFCACFIAVFSVFSLINIPNETKKVSAAEYGDTMYQSETISLVLPDFSKSDYRVYNLFPSGVWEFNFRLTYLGSDQVGIYLYADHVVGGMGVTTNSCVFLTYSDYYNNSSSILCTRPLFGGTPTYWSADSQFRVIDNYNDSNVCVVLGVTGNKDSTKSFAPYFSKFDYVPINSLVPRTYNNNQPFYQNFVDILNSWTTDLSVVTYTLTFVEGDSIVLWFVVSNQLTFDTSPKYFFTSSGDEYQTGYDDGFNEGYSNGYEEGVDDTELEFPDIYDNGYDVGYQAGINSNSNEAYQNGYNVGKNDGYNLGYNTAIENDDRYSFIHLITAVIDVPINSFTELFNFELLGVNLSGFFLGLLTCCVVIAIAKLLI